MQLQIQTALVRTTNVKRVSIKKQIPQPNVNHSHFSILFFMFFFSQMQLTNKSRKMTIAEMMTACTLKMTTRLKRPPSHLIAMNSTLLPRHHTQNSHSTARIHQSLHLHLSSSIHQSTSLHRHHQDHYHPLLHHQDQTHFRCLHHKEASPDNKLLLRSVE